MTTKSRELLGLISAGLVIGVINGFFGGGGGMICVPSLLFLGLRNKMAQATAILIMLPVSIASGVVYYTNGFVDYGYGLYIALGAVLGGILGALLLKKLSNKIVKYIFFIVVILAGIKMLW